MFKTLVIFCISVFLFVLEIHPQSSWMEWKEGEIDEERLGEWETEYEELSELAAHPFNINTITKEQLEQLPFLSDKMIEQILYYLYKYGPMVSKKELLGIEGMDWQTRRFLQDFIYIGPADNARYAFSLKRFFKYNKQELWTRFDFPLNMKAGYAAYSDQVLDKYPNKKYYGSPFYHNLRYRLEFDKKIFIGFTAEKDAGEPFFSLYNRKGYDFYSGYLFVQDIGRIKSLAVGNYRASFGYGLVLNTGGFSMGKSASVSAVNRLGRGLSKYSSTAEYGYLQGIGTTLCMGKYWKGSLLYSFNRLDARVEDGFIRSLKTDGYHRLKKDMEKHHTASSNLIAMNLDYKKQTFNLGLTAVYNVFNKVLNPEYRPYNRFYPRGRDFLNYGIYYKFFLNKLGVSGELAMDGNSRLAALNILSYSPGVNTTLLLINRYYDKQYQSIYGYSFGENSKLQNETGSYIGLETSVIRNLKISGYFDFFHFFYRGFQVDKDHTSGFDGLVQTSYSPNRSLVMWIKYSGKSKAKNYTDPGSKAKYVFPYIRHRVQFQTSYEVNTCWSLNTKGEYVHTSYGGNRPSGGWLWNGTVKWKGGRKLPLQCVLTGAYFSTDNYDARVYMYEPGLLYAFSVPSFYGKGTRLAVNLRYSYKNRIVIQGKWGWTHYGDRNSISSGTEEIQGSNKSDVQIQLKVKW